jgi:hypothetical protein
MTEELKLIGSLSEAIHQACQERGLLDDDNMAGPTIIIEVLVSILAAITMDVAGDDAATRKKIEDDVVRIYKSSMSHIDTIVSQTSSFNPKMN